MKEALLNKEPVCIEVGAILSLCFECLLIAGIGRTAPQISSNDISVQSNLSLPRGELYIHFPAFRFSFLLLASTTIPIVNGMRWTRHSSRSGYYMARARRYFHFSTRILSQWATSRWLRTIRLLALFVLPISKGI